MIAVRSMQRRRFIFYVIACTVTAAGRWAEALESLAMGGRNPSVFIRAENKKGRLQYTS